MRTLVAGDLVLEPQTAAHAPEMFGLLSDPALYLYLDNEPPPSEAWLADRFRKLETRRSGDGREQWLNWVIRAPHDGLVGFVQATIYPNSSANIAYELGREFWGRGWATLATQAMLLELGANYAASANSRRSTNATSVRSSSCSGWSSASWTPPATRMTQWLTATGCSRATQAGTLPRCNRAVQA